MRETGYGGTTFAAFVVLGALLASRAIESIERRRIEDHFGDHDRTKRGWPRWEWAGLPAAIIIALSMWVFPTFSHYESACDKGYRRACYRLAVRHANGDGAKVDTAKAIEQYQKACDRGDGYGCHYLGMIYYDGKLVEQDQVKAVELFRQACHGGVAWGCSAVAYEYKKGELVPEDSAKAVELYQRACDWSYGFACFVLGDMREDGIGVEINLTAAMELYERSCDLGDELGCDSIARAYLNGRGVQKDLAKSVGYFEKVCEGDDPMGYGHGCFHVALAYANGEGVAQNEAKAAELYEKACRGGEPRVCVEVDRVSHPRSDVQLDDDVILGAWSNDVMNGGLIEIIRSPQGDVYVIEQVSGESATAVPGETTGELRVDESKEYDYEGRHTWGGSKTGETRWGRDGGLVIRMLDADTMFMRFLDSRYADGWVWVRQNQGTN